MLINKTIQVEIPDLGAKLSDHQKRSGLDVTVLCDKAKISRQYWYAITKESVRSIPESTLARLCEVLGISVNELN